MSDCGEKKPLDWAKLDFSYLRTDFRFVARYADGAWDEGRLSGEDFIAVHEGAPALHYAQQCFEGLKARTGADGRVLLFRPELNSARMNRTAQRLLMPEVPQDLFLRGVSEAVRANFAWLPPYGSGASLYIRPLLIGVGANLGLRPAQEYEFRVFVSPVGPYFGQSGRSVISLAVSEMDRAAPHGTGSYKAGANYAGGLLATQRAVELGADEALYLDSASRRYIDEAGSANLVVALRDGSFVTPASDAILESVSRLSVMTLAREALGLATAERPIDLRAEIGEFAEVAACGTAAAVAPVGRIHCDGAWHVITGDGTTAGPVMTGLRDMLLGIARGDLADDYGWLHEVVL